MLPLYNCKKCGKTNLLANEITWTCIWPSICKECKRKISQEYRDKGGIKYSRNKSFKYKYGITLEQYEIMLINQDNKCLICERKFSNTIKPDVDHCHKTKKIRGILCHACNLALGYLREDMTVIQKLLDYLESHTVQEKGEENVSTV